jgi:hypothetical protein
MKAKRDSAVEEAQRLQHAVDAVVAELHVTRRILVPAVENNSGTVLGVSARATFSSIESCAKLAECLHDPVQVKMT